jgi:hypothetical protein
VDESDPETNSYDIIIGRELMHEIGISIWFSASEVRNDNVSIQMQSVDALSEASEQKLLFTQDPLIRDAERIQNIVESRYFPTDLSKIVARCNLLSTSQQEKLHKLLKKFAHFFDGALGN